MQRRAVAVYAAVFLLVGLTSGTLLVTADTPEVSFEDPDEVLSAGDPFEAGGQEYTVGEVTETEEGGDHGGAATTTITGTIEREETTEMSETWANDSTVEFDGGEWTVRIEGDDPTEFTLVEVLDRQTILENDSDADNETVERDGEEYVVIADGEGEARLVPADDYFPDPEERAFAAGDEVTYDNQTATVDAVTPDGATLVWTGTQTRTTEVSQGERITLGDTEYVVNFRDAETMTLSSDIEAYENQVAQIEQFESHGQGMWRVVIVSLLAAALLGTTAFMPSRY